MLSWVFSCFIGLCLFQSHVKAQLEGDGSPTCTCLDNNAEYCNLVREKCKSEWRDFQDPCYVNNAYECSGCNGGPCDCVYNTVDDTVSGVCQTEGAERKRYVQDKGTGTNRRKSNRSIKKYSKGRKPRPYSKRTRGPKPYSKRRKPNQARPHPRRKPSHKRPFPRIRRRRSGSRRKPDDDCSY